MTAAGVDIEGFPLAQRIALLPPAQREEVMAGIDPEEFLHHVDWSHVVDGMSRQEIAAVLGVSLDRVKEWRSSGILSGGERVGVKVIYTRKEISMIYKYYLGGDD